MFKKIIITLLLTTVGASWQFAPTSADNLQQSCENLLKKDHIKGSIIVYDIKKDKIIALTSPNIAQKNYYPMGSTFKIISAFVLCRGLINQAPTITCNNYYKIGNKIFICTKPGGHGGVNLSEAIAYSCSVYFYKSYDKYCRGERPLALTDYAKLLLDDKINKCKIKEPSDCAGLADMLVGDGGFVKIKPIQMINLLKHLIKEDIKADKNCYAAIKKGMKLCCINGTAKGVCNNAAGKTGTPLDARYKGRFHGWFIGWEPVDNPKTAVVVFLEDGKGYEAAAIAGKVLKQATEAQRHRDIASRGGVAPPLLARDLRVRIFSLEKKLNNVKINNAPIKYNNFIAANRDVIFTVNGKTKEIYCKNIYFEKDKIIITSDIEHLTAAITFSEIHSYNLPEYVKAQAVCARSYLASNPGKHFKDGYDFCDSTCCQVIKGGPVPADLEKIIKSTKGECLYPVGASRQLAPTKRAVPLQAFYHSTCGGKTAGAEDVFSKKVAGIVSVKEVLPLYKRDLCKDSPHYAWEFAVNKDKLNNMLNARAGNYLLDVQAPVIKNGRVKQIKFIGQKVKIISGYEFYLLMGSAAGWGNIKSTYFTVRKDKDNFMFKGRGLGHGIGLCQYGACKMAQMGYGYKDILKHYFPETKMGSGQTRPK